MTQAELVTLCKSLGFCGEPDRCVKGSYYANLNPEKYTGPTLIYQPVDDTNVYISPKLRIMKNHTSFVVFTKYMLMKELKTLQQKHIQ